LQRLRRAGPITNEGKHALTHDFKETIRARAQREPKFRQALLREAVEAISPADLETGKSGLRDYVNAAIGFQALEEQTNIPAKAHAYAWAKRAVHPRPTFNILTVLQKTKASTSSFR